MCVDFFLLWHFHLKINKLRYFVLCIYIWYLHSYFQGGLEILIGTLCDGGDDDDSGSGSGQPGAGSANDCPIREAALTSSIKCIAAVSDPKKFDVSTACSPSCLPLFQAVVNACGDSVCYWYLYNLVNVVQ